MSAQPEHVAVDRIRVEMDSFGMATRRERTLGEAERDERLRADVAEARSQRRLTGAWGDHVLRLGEEERA